MADVTGNVIAVGSVAELADILANMSPEQLQNVTLDPALYEALSQTIEPQPEVNNESTSSIMTGSFEQVGSTDTLPIQSIDVPVTVQSVTNSNITQSDISIHNAILSTNTLSNINPNFMNVTNSFQVENNSIPLTDINIISNGVTYQNVIPQSNTVPLQIDNKILQASTNLTPMSIINGSNQTVSQVSQIVGQAVIPPNLAYGITTPCNQVNEEPVILANVTIAPQTFSNLNVNTNPMMISSLLNIPTCVQIVQTPPVQVVNQSTIQGILPGEAGSLIITPTIMSQVQPTASIQALQIPNTSIIPNTSAVSITSNPSNFSTNANLIVNPVSNMQPIATLQNINDFNTSNNSITNTFNITPVVNLGNATQPVPANIITQDMVPPVTVNLPSAIAINDSNIANKIDNTINAESSIISDNGTILANIMPNEIPLQQLIDAGLITIDQVASMIQVNRDQLKTQPVQVNSTPLQNKQASQPQQLRSTVKPFPVKTPTVSRSTTSSVNTDNVSKGGRDIRAFLKENKTVLENADRVVHINIPDTCIDKSQATSSQVKVVNNVGIITTPDVKKISVKPKSVEQVLPGVFKVTLSKVQKGDTVNSPPVLMNTLTKSSKSALTGVATNVSNTSRNGATLFQAKNTSYTQNTPSKIVKMGANVVKNFVLTGQSSVNKSTFNLSNQSTKQPPKTIRVSVKSSEKLYPQNTGNISTVSKVVTCTGNFSTPVNTPKDGKTNTPNTNNVDRIIKSVDNKKVYVVKKISTKDQIPKGAIVLPKGVDIEAFQKKLGLMDAKSENLDFIVSQAASLSSISHSKSNMPSSNQPNKPTLQTGDKPTKLTFSRSFKKTSNQSSAKEKTINKTLSKEENEVLNIQQAIKSSSVGEGEKNMRNLAKMEIEKQLKRFAQKLQPSLDKTKLIVSKTKHQESRNVISPDSKRRKIDKKPATSLPPKKTIKGVKEQAGVKNDNLDNSDEDSGAKSNNEGGGRKRSHPRKYEDYILSKEKKRTKVEKKKKFFFPPEDETENQNTSIDNNIVNDNEKECNADKSSYKPMRKNNDERTSSDVLDNSELRLENNEEKDVKDIDNSDAEESKKLTKGNRQLHTNDDKGEFINNQSKDDNTENESNFENEAEQQVPKDNSSNVNEENTTKKQNQVTNKKKKIRKKKKKQITFEPEVLPAHLKTKPKAKSEDMVIDLSKIKLKTTFAELSFYLDDVISYKTYKHLRRPELTCTLCNKPSKIGTLDVLFGAYKVKVRNKNDITNNDTFSQHTTVENKKDDVIMDVWFHRDCVIWTSTISLANQTLLGVGDALEAAGRTKCCSCGQYGATLECCVKQCRDGYHFVCAKQRGCTFLLENFTITCPKHK